MCIRDSDDGDGGGNRNVAFSFSVGGGFTNAATTGDRGDRRDRDFDGAVVNHDADALFSADETLEPLIRHRGNST